MVVIKPVKRCGMQRVLWIGRPHRADTTIK
jgi:hypothetical protein